MDAAKLIAMLATNEFPLKHYFGENKIENRPLPIIAVPLTAGSGSEVTPFSAVTTDNDFLDIEIVRSPLIYPKMAFVDPRFTLSFPSAVTVNNGIDALVHAIESIVSKNAQPLIDIIAVKSIRLVSEYLIGALDKPENLDYRSKLSYASLLSGIAIGQTGLGMIHQMGFPLTLEMGVAHGRANGLLLPGACEWILNRVPQRLDTVSKGFETEMKKSNEAEKIEKIISKIRKLNSRVGVVAEFESKDMIEKKISDFTERASSRFGSALNISRKRIKKIYKEALMRN